MKPEATRPSRAGAVLVVPRERVHPLNLPFTSAVQVVSKRGSGSKALVAAMKAAKARECQ